MTKTRTTLVTALLVLAAATPATAAEVAGAFGKGRTHLAVIGGSGYAFDESYFVLGVGASYYVLDGLNVGLYAESWTGGDPTIYKVTPSVQYVFYQTTIPDVIFSRKLALPIMGPLQTACRKDPGTIRRCRMSLQYRWCSNQPTRLNNS